MAVVDSGVVDKMTKSVALLAGIQRLIEADK